MNRNEDYVLSCMKNWIWSGFYTSEEVESMIDDILEEDCDVEMLKSLIGPEFETKRKEEMSWQESTDCDKLDKVFYHLHEKGICALRNAGYTMSDGFSDVAEVVAQAPVGHYHSFCFYHGQDVERALSGHGLMIAFGSLNDDPTASIACGESVSDALRQTGFVVEWDSSINKRISIPKINWQRRYSA